MTRPNDKEQRFGSRGLGAVESQLAQDPI